MPPPGRMRARPRSPRALLPRVRHDLEGWALVWARLTLAEEGESERLEKAVAEEVAALRHRLELEDLAKEPRAAAMRGLFRRAGCDPTRHRPSSEALARRVLRGDPFPRVLPGVDLN